MSSYRGAAILGLLALFMVSFGVSADASGLAARPTTARDASGLAQLNRAERAKAMFSRDRAHGTRAAALRATRIKARPNPSRSTTGGPPVCAGHRATIVGTDGNDMIQGTPGRDVIVGLGGNDEIHGRGQDDIICGGPGDDVIFGEQGNDTLLGDDGHDFVDGGLDNDFMDGGQGDFDGAAFFDETGPVTASLAAGTATGQGADRFTNVEELHGGQFSDNFTASDAGSGMFGNGGDDVLTGGAGDDYLSGGAGNDLIDGGGSGGDSVTFWDATGPVMASLETGTSSGGGGSDMFVNVESLFGGPYADVLTGDAGDNFLVGDAGNDTLAGGDGNDTLDGGAGDDAMDGGSGDSNAAAFFDESGAVTADLHTGTASGDGSDTLVNITNLHGGNYADTFIGNDVYNELFGNGGDDHLSGGDGDDLLSGGPGDDSLDGGNGTGDTAWFLFATGPAWASLVTGTSSGGEGNDNLINIENLNGSEFGDTLIGDAADNGLSGAAGDDTLIGGDGNDFLVPGSGVDTVDGGPGDSDAITYWDALGPITASLFTHTATGDGADSFLNIEQIHGSSYGDFLNGGDADAVIFGLDGNDTIHGGPGNDTLFGNNGDDVINGDFGDDFLAPGSGADTLNGSTGYDAAAYWDASGPITASLVNGLASGDGDDTLIDIERIHGSSFADTFTGNDGGNELFGLDGDDTLNGGPGDDVLIAGNGDDSIYGDSGNDYIDGEDGSDFADGGPDSDFCVNVETSVNCEAP
jgi:Ca2+-binding RTX toxin-like protein